MQASEALHLVSISVVTPSFNQVEYIAKTIESVVSQGYGALEYIVVDGASSDGSLGIIEKYGKCIDIWVSESDRGQSHALNKGLAWASGEVVAWINSDDILAEGALSAVGSFFDENPDAIWCTGSCELIGPRDNSIEVLTVDTGLPANEWLLHLQNRRAAILQPSTFWRRSAGEAVGSLREDLHYAFDFEFFYRLRQRFGPPAQLDRVLSKFRLHNESKTVSTSEMFFLEMLDIVREKANELPLDERESVDQWLVSERTRECFVRQQMALQRNNRLDHWRWRAKGWAHRLLG